MTKQRICATGKTMPEETRLEIQDQLTLALDEIKTGSLDYMAVRHIALMHLRPTLKAIHGQMGVMS